MGNYLRVCSSGMLRSVVKLSTVNNHGLWIHRPLKVGPTSCHETWLTKYQTNLRKITEEGRQHVRRDEA